MTLCLSAKVAPSDGLRKLAVREPGTGVSVGVGVTVGVSVGVGETVGVGRETTGNLFLIALMFAIAGDWDCGGLKTLALLSALSGSPIRGIRDPNPLTKPPVLMPTRVKKFVAKG